MAQSCKVLLIEDDDQDVLYFHETAKDVEAFDVTVTRVKQLEDGFEEVKTGTFDVIFLDLGLQMNPPAETMLQMFGSAGEIPVVVYTNSDAPELKEAASNLRFFDYVLKDQLTPAKFQDVIERALSTKKEKQAPESDASVS